MTDFRLKSYHHFLEKPMPTGFWGGSIQNYDLDFNDIYYFARASDRAGGGLVRRAGVHQGHVRQARHPGGGEEVAHRRRRRPVRLRGRLPQHPRGPREARRHLRRHRQRRARLPGHLPAVLRHDRAAGRQQVRRAQQRRLVGRQLRLRPGRREGRHSAAGLLPHQQGEHGPVRADADHRRGGQLRPLRRGLHGADVLDRLAAQRRRRDRREEERARPLHDDPELVDERLQPRDEARRRVRGRGHGVGRRQPRLAPDDEVPERLPDGAARARRGALAGDGRRDGQHQDAGAKMVHAAPDTTSTIISKSVSTRHAAARATAAR